MSGIAEFLLARIADDEAAAREATPSPWIPDDQGWVDSNGGWIICAPYHDLDISDEDAEHVTRWQPTRVLADCEVKRRIVEWHQSWPVLVETPPQFESVSGDINAMTYRMTQQIGWTTQEEYRKRFGSEPPTAPILRLLALPYADHPDYQAEWRP